MEVIVPKAPEVFISLFSFLVLLFVLWKFAFPPVTAMLEKRSETIRESLEKAEQTRIDAERLLDEYKAQMAEARGEAAKVIEQGRAVAETMRGDIVAKAEAEAASMLAKAKDEIDAEKRAAMAEIQATVADLSVSVAGKVIGATLKASDHRALIERSLAEAGSLRGN